MSAELQVLQGGQIDHGTIDGLCLLTPDVKQKLLAPFQAAEVRIKQKPSIQSYITARVAMTRLDEVLPFQWSFVEIKQEMNDGVLSVLGEISVFHPSGLTVRYQDWGTAPADIGNAPKKQAKHACSDCFKRCAVHLGVARYLYELTGTQGTKISKPGLEKALAAVGYRGDWDERHYGPVGGIREGDLEDEEENHSPAPPQQTQKATQQPIQTETPASGELQRRAWNTALPHFENGGALAHWIKGHYGKNVPELTVPECDQIIELYGVKETVDTETGEIVDWENQEPKNPEPFADIPEAKAEYSRSTLMKMCQDLADKIWPNHSEMVTQSQNLREDNDLPSLLKECSGVQLALYLALLQDKEGK